MSNKILAYGEAMVEFNQSISQSRNYLEGFGGDTSNFAIAAARQGADCAYISAVGDDHFGRNLLDLWQAEKVGTEHVGVMPGASTGIYFVTHDDAGHHFHYLRAGSAASRYTPQQLPLDAIAGARVLHLSGISLAISESACDSGLAAMAHARKHGVLTSLDTNLRLRLWPLERAREKMVEAFKLCDICLPSWEDVAMLTGLEERDAIVDQLLSYGIKLVAFKLGSEGCYVATPDERRMVAPYPVQALDATGAGDCFGGAFVAELVAGRDPFSAARYANVAAALSTTGYGAVEPIPHRLKVEAALGAC
ncbi:MULTISPECIES: sugar kinase [unclassified Herbaspirillum]|uniref:sugar kinase n=1 Tax=unclassified Herbaspirillum TaxID=2624150 RepID=UPI00114D9270|nr:MULTISPECIES: sugar kinase [unclassified Herbaspirillum]MBB5392183.1 2-dehydro-3-deoxygluconokinase [Herbaspirillum sp. SJZ102]TQK13640.1 2-keto-3-deoxygluconate kinase [Herbaspirillum sp. SJZ130]TQK15643.1 2-keto-3-deoxygluconate kinase [Herbaspirillum sp. SJZ106]